MYKNDLGISTAEKRIGIIRIKHFKTLKKDNMFYHD